MSIDKLEFLHTILEAYYTLYKAGQITEDEYLYSIKPIDEAIDSIERCALKKVFILKKIIFEREKRENNIPKGMSKIS